MNLRQKIKQWRNEHKSISLIPTMGNLHDGHMALINAGRVNTDKVIVSIFVNPMQFDRIEDLIAYPRTLKEDCKKLINCKVDMIFTPTTDILYPEGISNQTFVDVPKFSNILEGKNRPGHFRGVATIISKLFNLVQPDVACFGEKDYQQLMLVRQLVYDMNYDIEIIGVPTVRAHDGLALSSRNSYLSAEERLQAPKINHLLMMLVSQLRQCEYCKINELLKLTNEKLLEAGFKPDILAICDSQTLQPLTVYSQRAVILLTVWLGKTRLIDNAQVDVNYHP